MSAASRKTVAAGAGFIQFRDPAPSPCGPDGPWGDFFGGAMRAFHYTDLVRLPRIIEAGEITPGTDRKAWGITAAWFTCSPQPDGGNDRMLIDRATGKPFTMTVAEKARTVGIARIAVEADGLMTLQEAAQAGILTDEGLDEYRFGARACGADPDDWCISPVAVRKDQWLAVQLYDRGRWHPAEGDAMRAGLARLERFTRNYSRTVAPMIARGPAFVGRPKSNRDGSAPAWRKDAAALIAALGA